MISKGGNCVQHRIVQEENHQICEGDPSRESHNSNEDASCRPKGNGLLGIFTFLPRYDCGSGHHWTAEMLVCMKKTEEEGVITIHKSRKRTGSA